MTAAILDFPAIRKRMLELANPGRTDDDVWHAYSAEELAGKVIGMDAGGQVLTWRALPPGNSDREAFVPLPNGRTLTLTLPKDDQDQVVVDRIVKQIGRVLNEMLRSDQSLGARMERARKRHL